MRPNQLLGINNMKKIVLLICVVISGVSCTHTDPYASLTKDELILKFLDVYDVKDIRMKTVNDYLESVSDSVSPEFLDAAKRHLTWEAGLEFRMSFLREHYSRDEIVELIKMYEYPEIKRLALKGESLAIQINEAQKKWIAETYADIQEELGQSTNTANKIKIINEAVRSCYERGVMFFEDEEYDRALLDFLHVVETAPTESPYLRHVYWRIANIYIWEKEYEKAVIFLNKLSELMPDDWWAYERKGFIRASQGRYDEAKVLFNRAAELNPDSETIRESLKRLEEKSGQDMETASGSPIK